MTIHDWMPDQYSFNADLSYKIFSAMKFWSYSRYISTLIVKAYGTCSNHEMIVDNFLHSEKLYVWQASESNLICRRAMFFFLSETSLEKQVWPLQSIILKWTLYVFHKMVPRHIHQHDRFLFYCFTTFWKEFPPFRDVSWPTRSKDWLE